MSDQLSKELLNAHMKNVYSKLESSEQSLIKIFDRLDTMNVILAKNTIIVEKHEERSTKLETIVETTNKAYQVVANQLSLFNLKVEEIEEDLGKIKKHVDRVNKIVTFLDGVPNVIKISVLLVTLISSSIGLFTVYKEAKKAIVIESQK